LSSSSLSDSTKYFFSQFPVQIALKTESKITATQKTNPRQPLDSREFFLEARFSMPEGYAITFTVLSDEL
jgi:hypothetical protein